MKVLISSISVNWELFALLSSSMKGSVAITCGQSLGINWSFSRGPAPNPSLALKKKLQFVPNSDPGSAYSGQLRDLNHSLFKMTNAAFELLLAGFCFVLFFSELQGKC